MSNKSGWWPHHERRDRSLITQTIVRLGFKMNCPKIQMSLELIVDIFFPKQKREYIYTLQLRDYTDFLLEETQLLLLRDLLLLDFFLFKSVRSLCSYWKHFCFSWSNFTKSPLTFIHCIKSLHSPMIYSTGY